MNILTEVHKSPIPNISNFNRECKALIRGSMTTRSGPNTLGTGKGSDGAPSLNSSAKGAMARFSLLVMEQSSSSLVSGPR